MNQQFDMNISGAIELTDAELGNIQGGGFFGDAWDAVKGAATATWNALSSPTAQKIYATLGGLLAVFGGAKKIYNSTSSSSQQT